MPVHREREPGLHQPVQQLVAHRGAVVTWPAVGGLSSKARHSADSASIFAVSVVARVAAATPR